MSKPFMFHFTAKLYTFFYSRNFFRNFFLKKAKKISSRKQKLSFYVIKHIFIAREQKKLRKREDFRS